MLPVGLKFHFGERTGAAKSQLQSVAGRGTP